MYKVRHGTWNRSPAMAVTALPALLPAGSPRLRSPSPSPTCSEHGGTRIEKQRRESLSCCVKNG
eukprot:687146-Hanusia_phi.AAC.1